MLAIKNKEQDCKHINKNFQGTTNLPVIPSALFMFQFENQVLIRYEQLTCDMQEQPRCPLRNATVRYL